MEIIEQPRMRQKDMDIARGIGMLAVMTAHLQVDKGLYIYLYTFHLPLFFLISGYFYHYEDSFKEFLLKKAKAYLIPYAFCAAVLTLGDALAAMFKGNAKQIVFADMMKFLLQIRYSTLWFLAVLFLGVLIFWLIVKLCRKGWKKILISSAVISTVWVLYDTKIGKPLPWNLDTAFIIQIYLAAGYTMKETGLLNSLKQKPVRSLLLLEAVSLSCSLLNFKLCAKPYEMYYSTYGIFPLTIAAAVTGSLAVILLSGLFKKAKFLAWLGRNTMAFFAFHQGIAIPCSSFLLDHVLHLKKLGLAMQTGYLCLQMLLVIVICWLMLVLIQKLHMGFLLGQKKYSFQEIEK